MTVRYAIYYAPPAASALWRFGSRWLGRDAETGQAFSASPLPGLATPRWRELTEEPRVYGFHATLKPPFRLADGAGVDDLSAELSAFAASREGVAAPPQRLAVLDGFLALVLSEASPAMSALAAGCVEAFDRFRAPPDPEETARRLRASLTDRQRQNLAAWGYPYVMDDFRFHMTLTGRLDAADAEDLRGMLAPLVAPLVVPLADAALPVDELALFEQPRPGHPFRLRTRYPLRRAGAPAP